MSVIIQTPVKNCLLVIQKITLITIISPGYKLKVGHDILRSMPRKTTSAWIHECISTESKMFLKRKLRLIKIIWDQLLCIHLSFVPSNKLLTLKKLGTAHHQLNLDLSCPRNTYCIWDLFVHLLNDDISQLIYDSISCLARLIVHKSRVYDKIIRV